ncbi:hypothetical protein KGO06_00200 [Patescibacteria group bacterium]|nr:hypothetical protein [Patescibacteria group bacterium]
MEREKHEQLVAELRDPTALAAFCAACDSYRPHRISRILAGFLINAGNVIYGARPSYGKFKALEVIARIPYQSWEAVAYTLLTVFYSDEHRAIRLSRIIPFARHAQDNETMHVVVLSALARRHGARGFIRFTAVPLVFSFAYYWAIWVLSIFDKHIAFEINFLFESHAYEQYRAFIDEHALALRGRPVESAYLRFYGRTVQDELELFESIALDEVIHRNASVDMLRAMSHGHAA